MNSVPIRIGSTLHNNLYADALRPWIELCRDGSNDRHFRWVSEEGSWQGSAVAMLRRPDTVAFVHGVPCDQADHSKRSLGEGPAFSNFTVMRYRVLRTQEAGTTITRAMLMPRSMTVAQYVKHECGHVQQRPESLLPPVLASLHAGGLIGTFKLPSTTVVPSHIHASMSFRGASFASSSSQNGRVAEKEKDAAEGKVVDDSDLLRLDASLPPSHRMFASVYVNPGVAFRSEELASLFQENPDEIAWAAFQIVHTLCAFESRFPGMTYVDWERAFSWHDARTTVFGSATPVFVWGSRVHSTLWTGYQKDGTTRPRVFTWFHSAEHIRFRSSDRCPSRLLQNVCCALRMLVLAVLRASLHVEAPSHKEREQMLRLIMNQGWDMVLGLHEKGMYAFASERVFSHFHHLVDTLRAWEKEYCTIPPPRPSTAQGHHRAVSELCFPTVHNVSPTTNDSGAGMVDVAKWMATSPLFSDILHRVPHDTLHDAMTSIASKHPPTKSVIVCDARMSVFRGTSMEMEG